jgi:aspartate racemase
VSKVVGVLGGMGPAATLDFQARLLAATPARRDQDHLRVLVDCNPKIPDRNAALAGEGPSPAPALAAMARGLQAQGAELLVMPCNTAHAFARDIEAAVDIPFISLIEAAADEAAAAAPGGKVGVLAVDGARAAGLYPEALAARGLDAVLLDADQPRRFMACIYAVKSGDSGAAVRTEAAVLAGSLQAAGARTVIAACTELALVLSPADISVPLIDSIEVLVRRTLDLALEPDR